MWHSTHHFERSVVLLNGGIRAAAKTVHFFSHPHRYCDQIRPSSLWEWEKRCKKYLFRINQVISVICWWYKDITSRNLLLCQPGELEFRKYISICLWKYVLSLARSDFWHLRVSGSSQWPLLTGGTPIATFAEKLRTSVKACKYHRLGNLHFSRTSSCTLNWNRSILEIRKKEEKKAIRI